jgi:hypothetical protein
MADHAVRDYCSAMMMAPTWTCAEIDVVWEINKDGHSAVSCGPTAYTIATHFR